MRSDVRRSRAFYTVTDGKETLTLPILYAFGEGKAGQTYVLEYQGEYYESLVSYYKDIRGLDFTVGDATDNSDLNSEGAWSTPFRERDAELLRLPFNRRRSRWAASFGEDDNRYQV